ncbi:hypothetical protein LguiA_013909 [Lonicera macranthoides]
MASPQKSNTRSHIRSVSLPTRSNPATLQVEEELNRLKIYEVSSTPVTGETICKSFLDLEGLYKCVDNLLSLPLTQQVISQHKHEKWVDELLDGSLRLLDICGNTMDLVLEMKEHLGDVHSCLRRRKGDSSIQSSFAKFTSFRKKMKKEAKRSTTALKQMEKKVGGLQILDLDHHISSVIEVLREASTMGISTFQSLLMFLSVPVLKQNQTKWSLVSNLTHKGQVDSVNELESVDAALCTLCKYGSTATEKMQISHNRIEELEARVEELESSLECIFRHLIRTRASFLNIVSY